MNDFTQEELQYFLMTMKPFHFLWQGDPLELENKLQAMIANYCEHKKTYEESVLAVICTECEKIKEYWT